MAYVNYKSTNNRMLGGSYLSQQWGTTGAGIGIGLAVIGAAYLGYEYGGAASESLFGSTTVTDTGGYSGVLTNTTTGSIGTGGFWSTMGDWGTTLWGGLKTVGGGLVDVGKVVLPAAVAIGPGVVASTAQSDQQKAAIKAHQQDVAAAQKVADNKAAANNADIIDYTNSGGSQTIADVAKTLGISPTMVKTIGVAGIGAIAIILMVASKHKGA